MKIQTEIRVKTTKRTVEPQIRFHSGIEALTIAESGHLGYHHNDTTRWYSGGELVSVFNEPDPGNITLPRINVKGTDREILDQIEGYARKLLGLDLGGTGNYPDGTLYLIDLYGESDSVRGTSSFDVAIVLSTAVFDWTGARKVPAYLGWIGLEVPDLPERPRKSRYKRDPVI